MLDRCKSANPKTSKHYGLRGITVCDRWLVFENFLLDMGKRPDGMSLDRIDVNGNYEPQNCRWATTAQQGKNKRSNVFITANGKTLCIAEWSRVSGLSRAQINYRLKARWLPEDIVTNRRRIWSDSDGRSLTRTKKALQQVAQ
jgi:hypothetical protein